MLLPKEQFNDDTGAVNKQQHIFKYLLTTFDHAKINGCGIKGTDSHWSTGRIPMALSLEIHFPIRSPNSMLHLFLCFFATSLYGENGRKRGRKKTKFSYAV